MKQSKKTSDELRKQAKEIVQVPVIKNLMNQICEVQDKNLKDFNCTYEAKSNVDYEIQLRSKFDDYIKAVDRPAFRKAGIFVEDIRCICQKIIEAYNVAKNEERDKAGEIIHGLLEEYKKEPFAVTSLDESYAFRGSAAFEELQNKDEKALNENMLRGDLNFFRARIVGKEEKIRKVEDINYLAHSKRNLAKDLRFSSLNNICLYLGTTSYVCAKEGRWNGKDNLFLASFKFNEKGKSLKIFNFVILQSFMNGVASDDNSWTRKLYSTMIKIYPLIIATMFTVKTDDEIRKNKYGEKFKAEYLLSQLIIENLKKSGIDGIAYLSRQGKNDFQYPQMVCVAFPISDSNENDEYGKLKDCYELTRPVLFNEIKIDGIYRKRSYINEKFSKLCDESLGNFGNCIAKIDYDGNEVFYEDTSYSKFDDYLVNLDHVRLA